MGFPPVKVVPHLTQRYFFLDPHLLSIRLTKMKITARVPLIRIKGTTNEGRTVPIKKYASNPSMAMAAQINPKDLMTFSFE
jgi:hypothetical protein